jgi:cobalt-precorrin-5B (C1)-methyltransferase
MNTALQAYDLAGETLADWVARESRVKVLSMLPDGVAVDTVVIDRAGTVLARAGSA